MRRKDGGGKLASRGVSRADNYLSWTTYKDALFRPRRFQELCQHFGVRVTGRGRLAWLTSPPSRSPTDHSEPAGVYRDDGYADEEDDGDDEDGREEGGGGGGEERRGPLSQQPLFTYSPGPIGELMRSRSAPAWSVAGGGEGGGAGGGGAEAEGSLRRLQPSSHPPHFDPGLQRLAAKLFAWTHGQV